MSYNCDRLYKRKLSSWWKHKCLPKLYEYAKMPFNSKLFRLGENVTQRISFKFFLLVTSASLVTWIFLIYIVNKENDLRLNVSLVDEALENVAGDPRYAEVFRKKDHLSKNLKYILLWTPKEFAPFFYFEEGQRAFIKKNCSSINCYVTDDRLFFGGDLIKFDAIAFNGRNIKNLHKVQLPQNRSSHQKYIYFNIESSDNYPVCHNIFDDFFNWTATYRLDSDIPFPYIQIKNSNGVIVGPKRGMTWKIPERDERLFIQNKKKAAAWFVSNCSSRSGRNELVLNLQRSLLEYSLKVDVYGDCGTLKCPRNAKKSCELMLGRDYFFYLALENSFAEDYVTEKLLTAIQHDVVPIVFGGADYSRFLPPDSYLNAVKMNVGDLALAIAQSMLTPELYSQFFRWKPYFSYHDPSTTDNVCALCAALNNATMMEQETVYRLQKLVES